MTELQEAFKCLGLAFGDYAGVEKAHRDLVKRWHPDVNPGDKVAEERLKRVNAARDLLNKARANSDSFRSEPDGNSIFDSFMKEFHARRAKRGNDVTHTIGISLEEAARGSIQHVKISRLVKCSSCSGLGGKDPEPCQFCEGSGMYRQSDGPIHIHTPCMACNGRGNVFKTACADKACKLGRIDSVETLNIPLKAGIPDGYTLIRRGGGSVGLDNGEPGDLYIQVRVYQHQLFEREGNDLYQMWPISFVTATLGGRISVPTLLDGIISIDVPPGTQPGTLLTVSGKGFTNNGDMHVALRVDVPTTLTAKQKELLKEFAQEG